MQFAAVPIVLHVTPHQIAADFITVIVFGEELEPRRPIYVIFFRLLSLRSFNW